MSTIAITAPARMIEVITTAAVIRGSGMTPPATSSSAPAAGSASRARRFQIPVTRAEVVTARREKPQPAVSAYSTATPAAPPNGRRLLIALPTVLRVNPCQLRRPGSEAVRTKL